MNAFLADINKTHNTYVSLGVLRAGEKIASALGEEGVQAYIEMTKGIDADELMDAPEEDETAVAEKVASLKPDEREALAQAEFIGEVVFHKLAAMQAKHDEIAEATEDEMLRRFAEAHNLKREDLEVEPEGKE